ncbi:Alpha/Beta hydrolase protein [Armillaria borealis]|uniref:Alpha/Beta hydrolase protein n=1 Tax=Armillaria borealis TaxID=47425 RepID=A0AA39MLZ7_9AGAR|nr:Alpha/Beta hydrolase protein [Armillaria borealis]
MAHEIIFTMVVRYAKYHTMKNVTICKNGMEGYAVVKLPKDHDKSKFVVASPGFLAKMQGGDNDTYICSKVKSVKAVPSLINNDAYVRCGVFVVNAWVESEGIMVSDVIAVDISGHGQIVAQLKGMYFKKLRLNTLQLATAPKPKITEVAPALGPRSSPAKRSVDVQNTVLNIVGDTCGTEILALDVNADLETYGVDSLMYIEILRKFEESFPQMQFDATIFSTCNDITELVREISSTIGSQAATVVNTPETTSTPEPTLQGDASQSTDIGSILLELISSFAGFEISNLDLNADADTAYDLLSIPLLNSKLQTFFPDVTLDPTKPSVCSTLLDEVTASVRVLRLDEVPISVQKSSSSGSLLFLFHDGSGAVNYLRRLGFVGREFWGFNNSSKPWGSVKAIASAYADCAVKVAGSRPVIFGGWSFGGVVVFEAVRRGVPVKGIVLIDSPSPVDHVPSSNEFMAMIAGAFTCGGRTPIGRMMWKQLQQNAPPYPPLVLLHNKDGIPHDAFLPYPLPRWMSKKETDPCLLADDWPGLPVVGAPMKLIRLPGTLFTTFATPHGSCDSGAC